MKRSVWLRSFFSVLVVLGIDSARVAAQSSQEPPPNTGITVSPFTGLAKAPEANLFIGSATTEIPVQVPPGRAGLTPRLALKYSSHRGPSEYGYGWSLPLGKIQRSTKEGAIRCGKEPTTFVVELPDGQLECVLQGNRCWPTVEEAFLRIEFDAPSDSWIVWDRSGRKYTFGGATEAREPARPLRNCTTFRWYLTRVEDLNGNYLAVLYETNQRQDTSYPIAIQYTGNGPQQLPPAFEVRFLWRREQFSCPGDGRSGRPCDDRVIDATGGYPRELDRLLDRIEVLHFGGVVRRYGFEYEFDLQTSDRVGRTTFLTAVTLYDGAGKALSRLDGQPASTTFLYSDTRGAAGFASTQLVHKPSLPPQGNGQEFPDSLRLEHRSSAGNHTYRDVLDMNGDAVPDLIDGNHRCMQWQWDDETGLELVAANWEVYPGSLEGFATTPVSWDVREVVLGLSTLTSCPPLRTSRAANFGSWSESDTFDLTGDGVPDHVSSRFWTADQPYWLVFPGIRPSNRQESWRFGPPRAWWAPRRELRRTEAELRFLGHDGFADTADLIDMNGDGRPDYVAADVGSGQILVWYNTGWGFETQASRFYSPWIVLRFTTHWGLQIATMADLNGDGLTDQIVTWDKSGGRPYSGVWRVMINAGNQAVGPLDWPLPPSECGWNGARYAANSTRGDVLRDLLDINGDGLLDVIEACRNGTRSARWRVWLNRGAGFRREALDWPAPSDAIRRVREQQWHWGTTVSFQSDVLDLDGDGLADFLHFEPTRASVTRNAAGAWCASNDGFSCSELGTQAIRTDRVRTDLLVQMENGIGSTIYLHYEPAVVWDNTDSAGVCRLPWTHWTVSEMTTTDGWCTNNNSLECSAPFGAHESTLSFAYAYGLYEPAAREFRGFRTVARTDPDGSRQLFFFHQDAIRLGRTEATSVVDAQDRLLRYAVESWQCVPLTDEFCRLDPSACSPTSCPHLRAGNERFWVRRSESLRYDTENSIIRKVAGTRNLGWDAYGNVTRTERFGSGTPSVETFTLYAHWDEPHRYLVDRALQNWTFDHALNRILERVWYDYDARGNLTTTHRWVDRVLPALSESYVTCPGGGSCTRTRLFHDEFGNVIATEDTAGARTEYAYDADLRTYVERTTNPLGHEVHQFHHPVCGTKLWETVPFMSGTRHAMDVPTNRWEYDSFCRLRAQYRSMDPPGRPYLRYRHAIGGAGKPSVVSIEQIASGSRRTARYQLFDGLGRLVQSQREAYIDRRRSVVIEATRFYDARGRLVLEFAPLVVRSARGRYVAPPLSHRATTFQYDELNRLTERVAPDGAVTRFRYNEAWVTETLDPCFVSGNCQGARTRQRRDAFGRIVETVAFSQNSVFLQGTATRYDAFGRVLGTVQAAAPGTWDPSTTTRYTYDSRGLVVERDDPNSGLWQYGYDTAGNLVYVNDPKPGQHTSLCYDAIGRLTARYDSTGDSYRRRCGDPQAAVRYEYDRPAWVSETFPGEDFLGAVSRLTAVREATGNNFTYYDAHGRPVANRVTLDLPDEGTTEATVLWSYDAAGNIASVTYPDGEKVRYRYDPVGQVYAVIGQRVYARRITYDLFGRPGELFLGNGVRDIREYGDASKNFRLLASRSERFGQTLQELQYPNYTANGLLAQITEPNAPPVADLDRSASFTYDGLGRLLAVRFPRSNAELTYRYDPLGNLVQKEGSLLFYGSSRPHQLTAVDDLDHLVQYDQNGNRLRRGRTTYEYDNANRLVRINGGAVEYTYDQAGNRIGVRTSGGTWTRNYFGIAEARDGLLTKYYFAGKILLASQTTPNTRLAKGPHSSWARMLATYAPDGTPVLQVFLRPEAASAVALTLLLLLTLAWIVPDLSRRTFLGRLHRARVALLVLFVPIATFPWPLFVRPASAATGGTEIVYYHLNHIGSTELVTSERGAVLLQIRYTPFGGLFGYFDARGQRLNGFACTEFAACRDFTGYQRDPASGLHYAGARFYDSDIGMFQSHDPAQQFANPYTYAAWNPTNWTDSNGEFVEILIAMVVAAALSAAVSAVAAAAQGLPLSQVGKAAISGAITGAVGVGLGVVVAAVNIGLASIFGTLPSNVAMADAVQALKTVAIRSAYSTVASHAARETSQGLGLPDELTSLAGAVAATFATYTFDQFILQPSDFSPVKGDVLPVSGTETHVGITRESAREVFYNDFEADVLVRSNLAQDGAGKSWWGKVLTLAYNHDHFGRAAAEKYQQTLRSIVAGSNKLEALGAASHYLQDQYALGHIFPGTHLFRGPFGAPIRGVIHQLVGGEVTFIRPSQQATTDLFRQYRGLHFT